MEIDLLITLGSSTDAVTAAGIRHNSAPFTFLLTRDALGLPAADYRPGRGRDALMADPPFAAEFRNQNRRVNRMLIQYVQEENPYVQTLFEVYCAVVLRTRYNEFDNH